MTTLPTPTILSEYATLYVRPENVDAEIQQRIAQGWQLIAHKPSVIQPGMVFVEMRRGEV